MPFLSRAGPGEDWSHQPHGVRGRRAAQARGQGWRAQPGPQGQGAEGMGNPQEGASAQKSALGGRGRDRLKSSWGQAGLEDETGPQRLTDCAAPHPEAARECSQARFASSEQVQAGPGGPGVGRRASPDSEPHPLSPGKSPQTAAYRPPPPPRRASAPPSAPLGPHAKPGDTLRARAVRSSGWDRARGPGLGKRRV